MRHVEIILWRERQDLVIEKKWEGSKREVRLLCETLNKKWDKVRDMVVTIVYVKVEMPMTHLWEGVA